MNIKAFILAIFTLLAIGAWSQSSVHWNDSLRVGGHKFQRFTDQKWSETSLAKPEDMKWFTEARFGMFVHLGVSSVNGVQLGWGKETRKIPDTQQKGPLADSIYDNQYKSFKLENFNPREFVKIAKEAGAKYIVIITKHHDGFHLWNTKYSDYNIMKTPYGKDYLKEFSDAVHEAGLRLGFYYSQRDWYHPDYEPLDSVTINDLAKRGRKGIPLGYKVHVSDKQKRYQNYMFNQITELLTNYGRVDILWFDAAWWGGMFTEEMWDSERLYQQARKLQPGIIINNRSSIPGDYDTPEQHVGDFQNSRPWETCMTITDSWAWKPNLKPKSTKECISILASTAGGDGNLLLNVGPKSDGTIETGEAKVFQEIGAWLKVNGQSIYGTSGGVYYPSKKLTSTFQDNKLYLHLLDIKGSKLILQTIKGKQIKKAYFLANNQKVEVKTIADNYEIALPPVLPDALDAVIVLEFNKSLADVKTIKTSFENIDKGDPKTHDLK
ncbi:MAG: alpha-L-fucosidase [Prolixibacteraceae bacterium]|nr:alpha-L-fucosidase [Prolixibacteraceae bacterium]